MSILLFYNSVVATPPTTVPEMPPVPTFTGVGDIEATFIDESPPNLFPENSDSNFGILRKNFCDILEDVLGQIDLLYNERWPNSSTQFLTFHEEQIGIPAFFSPMTQQQRQELVALRYQRGPFTPKLRNALIEFFINLQLSPGTPVIFGILGIPILSGLPLYSGITGSVTQYYAVVENVENFKYTVYIDSAIALDTVGLTRELTRITPAGITFSIISGIPRIRPKIIIKSYSKKTRIVRSFRRHRAKITKPKSTLAIIA